MSKSLSTIGLCVLYLECGFLRIEGLVLRNVTERVLQFSVGGQ